MSNNIYKNLDLALREYMKRQHEELLSVEGYEPFSDNVERKKELLADHVYQEMWEKLTDIADLIIEGYI